MPWCPECRDEYREGFDKCGVCNTELVNELEPLKNNYRDYGKEVLLVSVSDDLEAVLIESQLQFHGIPVLKKHRGAGQYLSISMGKSNLGIDLYVPSSMLENAKDIINEDNRAEIELSDYDDVDESSDWEEEYKQKRQSSALAVMLLPSLTMVIIFIIINIIQKIR